MTKLRYISQKIAQRIDQELMDPAVGGFSLDQLMELAGLSVAQAIAQEYPIPQEVCVVAGPGNNGGDGLVAARHLFHFGYRPTVVYPKPSSRFPGLVQQLKQLNIPIHSNTESLKINRSIIVDAVFGFGFNPSTETNSPSTNFVIRPPFGDMLKWMKALQAHGCSLVSIDVPSGWCDAFNAYSSSEGNLFIPNMIISLSAPKSCIEGRFHGVHYLGGRFIPPWMESKYELNLPSYPGSAQCVRVSD